MKNILISFLLLLCSMKLSAQYDNIYDAAYSDFNSLMDAFLQLPTDKSLNEEIYNQLENLQNEIAKVHVAQEERYKLNSLIADIKVVKEFISPISNKDNSHLSDSQLIRLKNIFGENFVKVKLDVKCPVDEVEFIEVKLGSLKICYFHNISKKVDNGLRIRYYAAFSNTTSSGDYGAMKKEYTPILHNVGTKYLKIISATIIERF